MGNKPFYSLALLILAMIACTVNLPKEQAVSSPVVFETTATATPVVFTVTGNVNVRSCPSASCSVIGNLYTGDTTEAVCFGGNWCRIHYENKNAWVFAPCLGQEGICK